MIPISKSKTDDDALESNMMQHDSTKQTEQPQPLPMGKRFLRFFIIVVAIGFVFLILLPSMGLVYLTELLFYLAVGWLIYLDRIYELARSDYPIILIGLTTVPLFAIGLKVLLQFLLKNSRINVSFYSSIMATFLICSGFIAGIGMIGTTHQLTWLLTSDKRLLNSETVSFRLVSLNNIRNIGVAVYSYEEYESKPLAQIVNQNGKAMHSWLTNLLPFMDNNRLYEAIDHEAAWNDDVNQALMKMRIAVFINPGIETAGIDSDTGYALSHYAANVRLFRRNEGYRSDIITDGTTQTILLGEVNSMFQPWGKPTHQRDPALGINKHPYGFGSPYQGYVNIIYADGHGSSLSDTIDPQVLKALSTPNGGDVIDIDF